MSYGDGDAREAKDDSIHAIDRMTSTSGTSGCEMTRTLRNARAHACLAAVAYPKSELRFAPPRLTYKPSTLGLATRETPDRRRPARELASATAAIGRLAPRPKGARARRGEMPKTAARRECRVGGNARYAHSALLCAGRLRARAPVGLRRPRVGRTDWRECGGAWRLRHVWREDVAASCLF